MKRFTGLLLYPEFNSKNIILEKISRRIYFWFGSKTGIGHAHSISYQITLFFLNRRGENLLILISHALHLIVFP